MSACLNVVGEGRRKGLLPGHAAVVLTVSSGASPRGLASSSSVQSSAPKSSPQTLAYLLGM